MTVPRRRGTGARASLAVIAALVGVQCTGDGDGAAPAAGREAVDTRGDADDVDDGVDDIAVDGGRTRVSAAPTTSPPTTTVAPPRMPTDELVGPSDRRGLTVLEAADVVPGQRYSAVRVVGQLDIPSGAGRTQFSECVIEGAIVTYSPLDLHRCVVTGGLYAYDTSGTVVTSLLTGDGQAFRPGTSDTSDALSLETPWIVVNTIMRVGPGTPPAHVEAAQVLGGVGITFSNVVFETGGPFNNTQTADLNFMGGGLTCLDCWFLGHGGYAIYSQGPDNVFIRPRFARNSEFGLLYPTEGEPPPAIIEPSFVDGEPIRDLP